MIQKFDVPYYIHILILKIFSNLDTDKIGVINYIVRGFRDTEMSILEYLKEKDTVNYHLKVYFSHMEHNEVAGIFSKLNPTLDC